MNSTNEQAKNICVIGAGAVGTTLGSLFSEQRSVKFFLRALSEPVTPILSGSVNLQPDPANYQIVYDVSELASSNLHSIWICTKAGQVLELLEVALPHLRPDVPLVLACNGLGIFMDAASLLGRRVPIVRCLFSFGAASEKRGVVTVSGKLKASLAALPENRSALEAVNGLLIESGFETNIDKDVATAEWRKAAVNAVVNSLCSIVNKPNGALLQEPELQARAAKMLQEIRTIAKQDGFELEQLELDMFLKGIENHADNINSTLLDLRHGRKTEMYYFLGRILRLAEDYGIEAQECRAVYDEFCQLEREMTA